MKSMVFASACRILLVGVVAFMVSCSNEIYVSSLSEEIVSENLERNFATYIDMPDGTKIAADIWLPENRLHGTKIPVLVELTRYWRIAEGQTPVERVEFFNQEGFAYAIVDGRGSGASFGVRETEQSVSEAKDFHHVIEWLANQPWSNDAVITTGVSYPGNTAEFSMIDAPEALRATIPRFTDFDWYTSLFFPGGLPNRGFLQPWSQGVQALDLNETSEIQKIHPVFESYKDRRVKPVDSDHDGSLLRQALKEHRSNVSLADLMKTVVYRDDFKVASTLQDSDDSLITPYRFQSNSRLKSIPSYHWASFFDAGTAAGAIARFSASTAPMKVVIGYWTHGAYKDTNPYNPVDSELSPSIEKQYRSMSEFLAPLKKYGRPGNDSAFGSMESSLDERALYYFTAGENVWKRTSVWPPNGTTMERFYFSQGTSLSAQKPTETIGRDQYQVDFSVGTGGSTRWSTQMGGPDVDYGDRAEADKRLLTYTSSALTRDVEITGHPVINLKMSSTEPDGAVIAYLEDVAPDGKVTMLTEGELRLIHRKKSSEEPPYPMFGPYHTFERKDAMPMRRGEVADVSFALLPLSVTVKKGHALRVALSGHDKDNFERVPKSGVPRYTFHRNVDAASFIDIPMMSTESETGTAASVLDNPF